MHLNFCVLNAAQLKKTMKRLGMRYIGLFMVVMVCMVSGCAEWDNEISFCACRQQTFALTGMENSEMIVMDSTSDEHCGVLVEALQGTWNGLGDRQDSRMIFREDGQYEMWQNRRGSWKHLYTHKFWIEYVMHQGMMRSELHMDLPDMEDYAVRYVISDGILVLEEPTWNEPVMRFAKE